MPMDSQPGAVTPSAQSRNDAIGGCGGSPKRKDGGKQPQSGKSYADVAALNQGGVTHRASGSISAVAGAPGKKPGINEMSKPTYPEIVRRMMGRRLTDFVNYDDSAYARELRDPKNVSYVDNVISIYGDGNCMFRAIAFAVNDPRKKSSKAP